MTPSINKQTLECSPQRRSRPSLLVTTASSPNLNANYNNGLSSNLAKTPLRKASLISISCSPKRRELPPESGREGLTTKQKYEPSPRKMPPSPPHDGELHLGDRVDVPGKMYGTVRFIGTVDKKKGTFVGVELSEEFASRGKNSGDVDGLSYFSTTIPGAGIFLPINRATRRISSSSTNEGSLPLTPTTPVNGGMRIQSQVLNTYTPPTPGISKLSRSVGAGPAPSPQNQYFRRPSLPRPESPLRKQQSLKPNNLSPSFKTPSKYAYANLRKLGQSVRGTQDSRDPSKKPAGTPRNLTKTRQITRSTSALGNFVTPQNNYKATPVVKDNATPNINLELLSSDKVTSNNDEVSLLRAQLEERDRQLKEQITSLAEMERALAEVQCLIDSDTSNRTNRNSFEENDVIQLRAMLREKNEKISMLTTEFDAHRADFRSTIDTLELASSETERVYEQRINELMQEINDLSDQSVDVNNVAKHLRQLESLVQELEEGLEDARRAEVEARGEVEFLRGEVERTRAELKRERGGVSNIGTNCNTDGVVAFKQLEQRNDEIRGLKKIIHSLSRDSVQELIEEPLKSSSQTPRLSSEVTKLIEAQRDSKNVKREINELHQDIDSKVTPPSEEPQRELGNFCRERSSTLSAGTAATQETLVARNSRAKAAGLIGRNPRITSVCQDRVLITETVHESDAYSSANESYCELCETPGHDILICTKVFNTDSHRSSRTMRNDDNALSPYPDDKPAPLSSRKIPRPPSDQVIINPFEMDPIAGKESGVIDMDKWCAVCEREGHESIDCPFEDTL